MSFDLETFLSFIQMYAKRLEELQEVLNILDNRIGDGDHGTNMVRGFNFAVRQLHEQPPSDLGSACNTVAMALLAHVGGASGPLYGTVFMKLAGIFQQQTEVDKVTWIKAMEAAKAGIVQRGKAEFGDKTMLDVWEPAVAYLLGAHSGTQHETHSEIQSESQREEACEEWVQEVEVAVLATRDRIAKKGRAAYLGPRSQGTCDPGSVSSGLFFELLSYVYNGGGELIPWETRVL